MSSNIKCLKLSKFLFPSIKLSDFGRKRSLLSESSFLLKGTTHFRSIVASHKESKNLGNDDLTQTFIRFKYLRLIKRAIREAGPIVEENQKLATLLTRAKENSLPANFIDFAMKISVDTRTQLGLQEILFENYCHIIIQYEDIDLSSTKPCLLKICDRSDAHLVRKDVKWPLRFEQVGMLFVKRDDGPSFNNPKEAQLLASKSGAKLVKRKIDAEGFPYWQFYCDPGELHKVKRQLTNEGCEIEEAYVGYIPKNKIVVPNAARKTLYAAIAEMNKLPSIDNVFTNIM